MMMRPFMAWSSGGARSAIKAVASITAVGSSSPMGLVVRAICSPYPRNVAVWITYPSAVIQLYYLAYVGIARNARLDILMHNHIAIPFKQDFNPHLQSPL